MTEIETIKLLYTEPTYDHKWVGSDPSKAFLACLGSGPWKLPRRKKVQEKAIKWLGNRDLLDIYYSEYERIFPFDWQMRMLSKRVWCAFLNQSFEDYCNTWMERDHITTKGRIQGFFLSCGSLKGTKVLWLFIRDFFQLPAFPIDRHIKRILLENNLPCDPWKMIELCQEAGIDPNKFNRSLFPGENPDYSNGYNFE